MKRFIKIGSDMQRPWAEDSSLSLKGLRKENWSYMYTWVIYYAWVIVFVTWWTASPYIDNIFGTGLRSITHVVQVMVSIVFIVIAKKEWFARGARIATVTLLLSMVLYMISGNGYASLLAVVLIGISVGCVSSCTLINYVFILNNTEKFYSMLLSSFLISLISILLPWKGNSLAFKGSNMIFSFALVAIALAATIFYKKEDIKTPEEKCRIDMPFRTYLTFVFSIAYFILCKGIGKAILNITEGLVNVNVMHWFCAGGITGGIIFLLVHAYMKKSIHVGWNITFGSLTMGLVFNAASENRPEYIILFALLLGIASSIGMINVYYMLGVIGKKYDSMKYVRLSLIFIGIFGIIAGVMLGNFVTNVNTIEASVTVSVLSAAVMLFMLIFSPLLSDTIYSDDWMKDSDCMEINNDSDSIFKKYEMTPREIEVCKLLLQGNTLRQISAMLAISYPTVNTYCTSIYRKLGINSRTELLILFKDYSQR